MIAWLLDKLYDLFLPRSPGDDCDYMLGSYITPGESLDREDEETGNTKKTTT